MARSRLANLLIDTTDRIVGAGTPEARWHAINSVAARIGAHAVNASGFLPGQIMPAWGWSSMDPDWLDEYFGAQLIERDPLLAGFVQGHVPEMTTAKAALRPGTPTPRDAQLYDGLVRRDYNHFCSHAWQDGPVNKLIVLACDRDPADLFGPGTAQAFRAVSAVLATGLSPPDDPSMLHDRLTYCPLSPRERDVLAYFAHGLSEADIAQRLGLTGHDLLRIQIAAFRKMGAATREQTLALALARGLIDL